MLYLIGLGLNEKGISIQGIEAFKKCSRIYLESYTVKFPYSFKKLQKIIGKKQKIIVLGRKEVESDRLIKEAKKQNIALLVYGCPLFATTHVSLLLDAKKQKIKTQIIYSASVFDAIAETGLQLYKFGKIASMPKWEKNFEPFSFLEIIEENKKINAHSLILIDIGLKFEDALNQLEESIKRKNSKDEKSKNEKIKIDKLIVCSQLGTSGAKIFYGDIKGLEKKSKKISSFYCLIIPGKLHFIEEQSLNRFRI